MDADQRKYIQKEIHRQLNVILYSTSGVNDHESETIDQMFPGMPSIEKRPVMHPFGFCSRAAQGIMSVICRVGDHFANRMVMGHRDPVRPNDLEEGESVIYSTGGLKVYMRNGKIQIGSSSSANPVVLGNELKQLLEDTLQLIADHTHIGNLGIQTTPPTNSANFLALKLSPVGDKKILSDKVFTEK